jgi:hypothetical protein
MSLLGVQRDMRAWLDNGREETAAAFSVGTRAGLDIYQNNYRSQLANCLEESFPVTLAWLGDRAFYTAIVAHVEAVPPSSWTLDHYARGFPLTLARLFPGDPEVGDLAFLECALGEAFVARDCAPLDCNLTEVDWDRAAFTFAPSLTVHPLSTNAPAIWLALNDGHEPPAMSQLRAAGALLVWRSDEACRFRATDYQERDALLFLMGGASTFGTLCASLGVKRVEQIGQWLGRWLADGMIAAISTGGIVLKA